MKRPPMRRLSAKQQEHAAMLADATAWRAETRYASNQLWEYLLEHDDCRGLELFSRLAIHLDRMHVIAVRPVGETP